MRKSKRKKGWHCSVLYCTELNTIVCRLYTNINVCHGGGLFDRYLIPLLAISYRYVVGLQRKDGIIASKWEKNTKVRKAF